MTKVGLNDFSEFSKYLFLPCYMQGTELGLVDLTDNIYQVLSLGRHTVLRMVLRSLFILILQLRKRA